jgi:hypothetical protein
MAHLVDLGGGRSVTVLFGTPFRDGVSTWIVLVRIPAWHQNYEVTVGGTTTQEAHAEAELWLHANISFLYGLHLKSQVN